MKGLNVQNLSSSDNLFAGGALGYQSDFVFSLAYIGAHAIYRIEDMFEGEVTLGTTNSVGGNLRTEFGTVGVNLGAQLYGSTGIDFFTGIRYRYDIPYSENIEFFGRADVQYLFGLAIPLMSLQIGAHYKIF